MKKSDNPNTTDPWKILEMEIQINSMNATDRMRDVMSNDKFEIFKKEMNEKGLD